MQINDVTFNADLSDILTELQSQLSINNISLLTKMKDSGTDIMVQCPYHGDGQERRPSAGIRKSDGLFHCFACNETHTLAEVVSHCFGKDDTGVFGWKWLLQNFSSVSVKERKDVKLDFERSRLSVKGTVGDGILNRSDNFVTEEELDKYRYIHPYMYERGLTDDIIDLFDIGYDDVSKSITFPVKDVYGNCLFVARRSVVTKWFNYPSGAEKPLYGLYELSKVNPTEVIVCESMLDALTCWVYGKYAVAMNGLGTYLQFKQLRELPCRKLILATDNDSAGLKARQRIRKFVPNKLIVEYVLPENRKDINELSRKEFDNLIEVF